MPLARGEAAAAERDLCWRMDRSNRKMKAIRRAPWKYVNDGGSMDLLFDLAADPDERANQGWRQPGILRDLKDRLARWEAEMDAGEKTIRVR